MTTYLHLPGNAIYHIQSKTGTPLCAQKSRRSFHFSPVLPPTRRLCPRCQKTAETPKLKYKSFAVHLTDGEFEKIAELAGKEGVSQKQIVERAIRAYLP